MSCSTAYSTYRKQPGPLSSTSFIILGNQITRRDTCSLAHLLNAPSCTRLLQPRSHVLPQPIDIYRRRLRHIHIGQATGEAFAAQGHQAVHHHRIQAHGGRDQLSRPPPLRFSTGEEVCVILKCPGHSEGRGPLRNAVAELGAEVEFSTLRRGIIREAFDVLIPEKLTFHLL